MKHLADITATPMSAEGCARGPGKQQVRNSRSAGSPTGALSAAGCAVTALTALELGAIILDGTRESPESRRAPR